MTLAITCKALFVIFVVFVVLFVCFEFESDTSQQSTKYRQTQNYRHFQRLIFKILSLCFLNNINENEKNCWEIKAAYISQTFQQQMLLFFLFIMALGSMWVKSRFDDTAEKHESLRTDRKAQHCARYFQKTFVELCWVQVRAKEIAKRHVGSIWDILRLCQTFRAMASYWGRNCLNKLGNVSVEEGRI